jgi:hypothetical protein
LLEKRFIAITVVKGKQCETGFQKMEQFRALNGSAFLFLAQKSKVKKKVLLKETLFHVYACGALAYYVIK